jgi:hypothetical protein
MEDKLSWVWRQNRCNKNENKKEWGNINRIFKNTATTLEDQNYESWALKKKNKY